MTYLDLIKDPYKVDIVIPTYKNHAGLVLCIESIRACTDVPYNIIVVNNGPDEAMHQYLSGQPDVIYIRKGPSTFAQAVNTGIKAGKGRYVVIMNDDVIVSRGWLGTMISTCSPDIGGVNPFSNCDKGWRHNFSITVGGVDLVPGANTIDQIKPIRQEIYRYRSPYHTGQNAQISVVEVDWLAFYCTLIPRKVIDAVGYLNESYVNSGEDYDYCMRIAKAGYKMVHNYGAFVMHFGAISRKILEKENPEAYHASDKKTTGRMRYLWGKKSVLIYSGPSFERWDFRSVDSGGIGGSETWQVMLARELSKLGYRVTVMCDCPEPGIKDGDIEYLHYGSYGEYVDQYWIDYFISSRTTDTLKFPVRAGKIYVISHDIWLLSPRHQMFPEKVTKYCVLSEWHRDFFSKHHGVPVEKLWITSNGIDFDRFDDIKVDRNPYRFHWSSSWDRGLDNVLYLWPFIKTEIPEAELHVFYGCNTWKASCLQKNDQKGLAKIAEIEDHMKQDGIFNHGRVGQKELAEALKKSSLLLYPQNFSESFWITGIEAQYAGVPVICNKYAGVTTTMTHPKLGETAVMLGNGDAWWPYSEEGRKKFLEETVAILKDREKWQHWSDLGRENAKRYSWANVAKMWDREFKS